MKKKYCKKGKKAGKKEEREMDMETKRERKGGGRIGKGEEEKKGERGG